MENIDLKPVDRLKVISTYSAKFSFFVYLFFIFFGTSLPFTREISGVEDITTSNPVNQFVFSILYVLSSLNLLITKHQLIKVIKKEKFISLFILWSFITIFWSDDPFVSFKRWLQVLGSAIIFISALLTFRSSDEAFKYFKIILIIYIPVTILAIFFIPEALGRHSAFLGLTNQKNMLGQVVLVSLIIWSYYLKGGNISAKAPVFFFWILCLILLIGTKSVTSILTAITLATLIGALYFNRVIFSKLIGKFFSIAFICSFFLSILLIIILYPELLESFFQFFGKDTTLTGRTNLWSVIFNEVKSHLFLGCGFHGFWVVTSEKMYLFYKDFTWLPNEAHLGYLDLLNETGIIGLSIFVLLIINYFINLSKLKRPHFWKWFIIVALIINTSESTLFRTNLLTGVMFTFSYFAMYSDLAKLESDASN